MVKRRISEWDWLTGHLKELKEMADKLSKIEPNVFYRTKYWTPLKLICLLLYLQLYTKIISKQKWCKNMIYVDLFADSGINKISKDKILGSPIIAAKFAHKPFDKFLLVEKEEKCASALKNRLREIGIKNEPFIGDCNNKIYRLLEELPEKSHFLAFVDPEGLQTNWETMEKLFSQPGDFIINFQTSGVARVWGRAMNLDTKADIIKLNKFYGDDRWKEAESKDDLLDFYKEKIKSHRKLIEDIDIKSVRTGAFHYNLIFAVKKTEGKSPWFKAVRDIKKRIENNTDELVKQALDILAGRSTTLRSFVE